MSTKYFLAVAIALTTGSVLAGCQRHEPTSTTPNLFSGITSKADSFGFSEATFHQLQEVFIQHQPPSVETAFYYYRYGCGYYHTNKKDELAALHYADSMLLLVHDKANAAGYQSMLAIANLSKGDVLFALKQYNEACNYYHAGKLAAERSAEQHTLSEYSYRLGMATYRNEKYNTAARYFKDAFEQGSRSNNNFSDFYRRQEILNDIALSYVHAGKPDSAIMYGNKALRYIQENETSYLPAKEQLIAVANGVIYGTLGQAYLQQHDAAGASLLQKSIAINQQPGYDNGNALEKQTSLAQYYLDTAYTVQLPRAYTVLIAMQQGLDTLRNEAAATEWNKLMSRYFALQGNKAAAYDYLSRYNALYEKQTAGNKLLAETNISSRLKLLQDRYEMSLLQTNNYIKTIYLQIAVLLCLLTAAILFLIVRSWKKEKRNSRVLTGLNKQVEQQKIALEVTVKQLDHQIKTKDYILRVIAHDLRNPISAISTLTRIVSEEYENEEENKEFLEMAQSACHDSLTMIDSIIQLSQQGRPETLKRQAFDLNEMMIDCIDLLRVKAAEKQQAIVLHRAKTPQYTFADADKLTRVVNNLVMNAIKFSFPNSTIDVYVKDKNNFVEIAVKDEGIGIPADMQDKVFDVFTEAKRKGTAREATFGLGLSICKQLVEAHGGTIWLESKEGLGTTFYVQLRKHTLPQPQPELEAEAI
jgi:signal transduction histidine kinase